MCCSLTTYNIAQVLLQLHTRPAYFLKRFTVIVLTTPSGSTDIAKFIATSANMMDYKLAKLDNSEPAQKNAKMFKIN